MKINTKTLSLAIADACRLAPRFANEDGELIFNDLRRLFPALTEDQADLITTRVCINAKAGSKAIGWDAFASDLLKEMSPSLDNLFGDVAGALDKLTIIK